MFLTVSLVAKHYDAFLQTSQAGLSISLVDLWTLLDCSVFRSATPYLQLPSP